MTVLNKLGRQVEVRISVQPGPTDREETPAHPKGLAVMPMKNPPHPGLSVRIDCLEPPGLSVTESGQGASRQPGCAIAPDQWQGGRLSRNGDSGIEGVRLNTAKLDQNAGGLRSGASPSRSRSEPG